MFFVQVYANYWIDLVPKYSRTHTPVDETIPYRICSETAIKQITYLTSDTIPNYPLKMSECPGDDSKYLL